MPPSNMSADSRPSTVATATAPSTSTPDSRRVKELLQQGLSPAAALQPFSARQRSRTMVTAAHPPPPLPRSTSELTVSTAPALKHHTASASVDSTPRADTPDMRSSSSLGVREERPSPWARTILHRSSRLLHRRKSSARGRSFEWLGDASAGLRGDVQEISTLKRHSRGELEGNGMHLQDIEKD